MPTGSPGTILFTDLATSENSSFNVNTNWEGGVYSNHFGSSGTPDGANIGYKDGSVVWKPMGQLTPRYTHQVAPSPRLVFYR